MVGQAGFSDADERCRPFGGMVLTGVREEQTMHEHRELLPWILMALTIPVKVTVRKRPLPAVNSHRAARLARQLTTEGEENALPKSPFEGFRNPFGWPKISGGGLSG